MAELSVSELKDLLTFGAELGLQSLQVGQVACVYGPRPPPAFTSPDAQPSAVNDEEADYFARYSSIGREQLRKAP